MPTYLSNIDLTGNQLLNAVAQNLATVPPAPTKGLLFFNTNTNRLGCGNGTAFDYLGGISVNSLDDVPDSATRLAFLVAERTKLGGIATAATANASDASLRDRSTHTGSQLAATVSDFSAAADARVVVGITAKANLAGPTFTGTVAGITATMVGLGSVDNTADSAKPVSTAQATADTAAKARANHTGTQSADTLTDGTTNHVFTATEDTKLAGIAAGATVNSADATLLARANHTGFQTAATVSDFATAADARVVAGITGKANLAGPTFTGTVGGITASMVGLGSVTNTTDAAKPVSTAQQTALDLKANLASPTFTGTVGGLTKTTVGLANVDNTTDAAKPVSTAQATADTAAKARANHTGTQLAATISDFSAAADARVQLIVNAAPAALDTLNELAAALGDDPNYAATITTQLGTMNTAIGLRALDSAVCHKFNTLVGNGAATSIVVTHNLNTLYVTTSLCQVSDNKFAECDIEATSANTITLTFTVAPGASALRLAVQG